MNPSRLPFALLLGALLVASAAGPAFACACCSYPTQRYRAVDKLASHHRDEIVRLRFASEAKLLLGEANELGLPGSPDPDEDWTLAAAWQKDNLLFSLKDAKGNAGTLTLALPQKISVSLTDTRDAADKGDGPPLYTEWSLTGRFRGDGIFRAAKSRNLTLILQGRGNSCTQTENFTHWMLSFGPDDEFVFYGTLVPPGP